MKIFFSGFGESADMGSSIIHNNSDSINGFTDIFKENYQNKNNGKMSEFQFINQQIPFKIDKNIFKKQIQIQPIESQTQHKQEIMKMNSDDDDEEQYSQAYQLYRNKKQKEGDDYILMKNKLTQQSERKGKMRNLFDYLHEERKLNDQAKLLICEQNKMEKENQELQKCTFYPNLDKNFSQSERKVTKKDIDKFYENERNWQLEKQYKINKILNDEKDQDLEHCSFKPQTNVGKIKNKENRYPSNVPKGVQQHLRRQILAQYNKQYIETFYDQQINKSQSKQFQKKDDGSLFDFKYQQDLLREDLKQISFQDFE